VAVIGAGPAGIYTADALTHDDDGPAEVDLIERLPVPYGLLRYGVAPDHLKIKAVGEALRKILERPSVRLFANVAVGEDVTVDQLRDRYDAIIYCLGASADRSMGIAGEELPGSASATEFVSWYNGHPDRESHDLSEVRAVAVVGVGNVALDVARMLLVEPADLEPTDVTEDVLTVLRASAVTDVHIFGRRAAQHVKFTTKELRELGELTNVDVLVAGENLPDEVPADLTPMAKRNVAVFQEWSERTAEGRPRRLHMHFRARPAEVLGDDRVRALRLERTTADGGGTGELFDVPVDRVLRSVGYRAVPVPGVPFDSESHTVPTVDHRVLRDGEPSPGEYAVGWAKRGATGVLGTNRSDATETIRVVTADAAQLRARRVDEPPGVGDLLVDAGVRFVDKSRWLTILDVEAEEGAATGRGRVKLADWDRLLEAAGLVDLT
jgi:ferredoxin--NADP+ reductase